MMTNELSVTEQVPDVVGESEFNNECDYILNK